MYTGLVTIFFVVLAWSSKPKHNLSMLANLSTLIIPTCRSTCRPTCVARISIGTRSLNCSVPTCWKLKNHYIIIYTLLWSILLLMQILKDWNFVIDTRNLNFIPLSWHNWAWCRVCLRTRHLQVLENWFAASIHVIKNA